MKKSITFYSEGATIAGDLYFPDSYTEGDTLPAVVLCHGFAGIKELLLPAYAEAFARYGFVALTFDYRGFGESEGERGRLVPQEQIVDIRNAITFLQTVSEVDAGRIGLWGTSMGGANAIVASAVDERVKCLVVQLTFGNGRRVISANQSEQENVKLQTMLEKAWQRAVSKNNQLKLPADQILTDSQSKDFYQRMVKVFPSLAVKIPILTLQHTLEHIPEDAIPKVNIPVFIVAAENDEVNPASESEVLFEKANHPKSYYCLQNASHYEIYEGEKFEDVAQRQIQWFSEFLRP